MFPWAVLKYPVPGREGTVTHFCAVERTLVSWSSGESLFCCLPCVRFSSVPELTALGKGRSCSGGKLQPALLPLPRQLLRSRAGLDILNGGVRDRPTSSFPVSAAQASLRAAALTLGLASVHNGQS